MRPLLAIGTVLLVLLASAPARAGSASIADAAGDEVLTIPYVGLGIIHAPGAFDCRDPSVDVLRLDLDWNATRLVASLTVADLDGARDCPTLLDPDVRWRWRVEMEPVSRDLAYREDVLLLDGSRDEGGAIELCARVRFAGGGLSPCLGTAHAQGDTLTWQLPLEGSAGDADRSYSFFGRTMGVWIDAWSEDAGFLGLRVRDTGAGPAVRLGP